MSGPEGPDASASFQKRQQLLEGHGADSWAKSAERLVGSARAVDDEPVGLVAACGCLQGGDGLPASGRTVALALASTRARRVPPIGTRKSTSSPRWSRKK